MTPEEKARLTPEAQLIRAQGVGWTKSEADLFLTKVNKDSHKVGIKGMGPYYMASLLTDNVEDMVTMGRELQAAGYKPAGILLDTYLENLTLSEDNDD